MVPERPVSCVSFDTYSVETSTTVSNPASSVSFLFGPTWKWMIPPVQVELNDQYHRARKSRLMV